MGQFPLVAEVDAHLLEDLINRGEIDAVLAVVSLDEIAAAWCRDWARDDWNPDEARPDWWASNLLMCPEVRQNSPLMRALILRLLDHADTEDLIGCVGAGPLEDYFCGDEDDLKWIEQQAAQSERFRLAVGHLWVANTVAAGVMARLDRAAGQPLARPRVQR
jgi:hypothetical protein